MSPVLPEPWSGIALPSSLAVELSGAIGIVRLTRPGKRNAIDDATVEALGRLFRQLPEGVRAVVLAAEGEHFCAGLDLSALSERDVAGGIAHSRSWHRAFDAIETAGAPVVAVLQGAVVGGGLELASAAHIRVAEQGAYFALPEGQRGIFVGGGGSVRVQRLIGPARMMDMMLTGRTCGAEEGLAIGLVQYVVARGAGLDKGLELAGKIALNTPLTNFAVTQVLPRIGETDPATGYVMEALMAAIAQGDPEAKARLVAFLEKRAGKVVHEG